MSETTTLLKAGATDLVLRMAEAGTVLPGLVLDNPVRAIGEVSRDITGRSRCGWPGGRQLSALDIQREYLARAKDFAGSAARTRSAGASWGCGSGRWTRSGRGTSTPSRGRSTGPSSTSSLSGTGQNTTAPVGAAGRPGRPGLSRHRPRPRPDYRLQRSGAVERTARDIDIFEAKTVPPARAASGRRADPGPGRRRQHARIGPQPDGLHRQPRAPGQLADRQQGPVVLHAASLRPSPTGEATRAAPPPLLQNVPDLASATRTRT